MNPQTSTNGFKGHVLIIGGGIGGNSLALFLQQAGISSTVYEAYAYKDAIGGGLGLAPNGMNVLAALGLAETVKARGTLNIENVFNKGYWASADGNNNLSPGQPRTVRLTASAKF